MLQYKADSALYCSTHRNCPSHRRATLGALRGDLKAILLLDVMPLSLGLETMECVITRAINQNTTVPTKTSLVFSRAADNPTDVGIMVLLGERQIATENKILGNFDLVAILAIATWCAAD